MSQKKQNGNAQIPQHIISHREVVQSGPLPAPEILAQYNNYLPGTGEKIVEVFVKQADHRMQLEREQLELKRRQMDLAERYARMDSRNSLLGIVVAASFGVLITALGAYAVHEGAIWAGSLVGGIGVTGIIGAFIYGTRVNHVQEKK